MTIQAIIEAVRLRHGMDLSVYSVPFLRKCIAKRVNETASAGPAEYLNILSTDPLERAILNDCLHIGYSLFFRNTVDTSLLEGSILPDLIHRKEKNKSRSFRIWSVGCSDGPEAYSLAILADKVIQERNFNIPVMVFGTDISPAALEKAKSGSYSRGVLQNVRLSYLDRYFKINNPDFTVLENIRNQVDFSSGDITDPGYSSPPAAIYADFDIVSCCNLLIYYNHETQKLILEKLFRSVSRNGFLLVGETERLIVEKFAKFHPVYTVSNIFTKS